MDYNSEYEECKSLLRVITLVVLEKKSGLSDRALVAILPKIYRNLTNVQISNKQAQLFIRWEKKKKNKKLFTGPRGNEFLITQIRLSGLNPHLLFLKKTFEKDIKKSFLDDQDPVLELLGVN